MNSPAGSESPALLDNYDRQQQAFIAMLRDGQGFSTPLDLASAATTDIGAQPSAFVRITGTTTITSLGTNYSGPRFLVFGGALTLTHNATSLILPGGFNIITAAGDCAIAIPNAATPTGWRIMTFERASVQMDLVGVVLPFARSTAPTGWLKANGAAVLISAYSELAAAIYVGDAANPTAISGYRCTDAGNPSGSRNIAGTYIVLPDMRGEFVRGLDDGRAVDAGRLLLSAQSSANLSHTHTGDAQTAGSHAHPMYALNNLTGNSYGMAFMTPGATSLPDGSATYGTTTLSGGLHNHPLTINSSGGTESRPRSIALLYCIKF
jgi:phage-related tail fiber protein